MSRKKKRGVPTLYSESKVKVGVSLTPTGAKRLGDIAKQLGLSRSEFVERIARGQFDVSESGSETTITLATKADAKVINSVTNSEQESVDPQVESEASQPSPNQDNNDLVKLQERYQTLQHQSEEQANTINHLEQQLTKLSQLETQLAETVPTQDYQQLQQQLETQLETVQNLEQQLETQLAETVPTQDYQQLQQQLEQQLETVQNLEQQLETQLAETVPTKDYQQLQQQLETQLETVQQLELQLAETVPTQDYQQLQQQLEQQLKQQQSKVLELRHQLEHQNVSITHLEHQLTRIPELETQLAQSLASATTKSHAVVSVEHSSSQTQNNHQPQTISHHLKTNIGFNDSGESYGALKQKVEEQEKTINNLRQEIIDLRRLASIAESHLGKWRHNTFSH